MARSYKKIAGGGVTTARSDKEYKVAEHRRYRVAIRNLIGSGEEEDFPFYRRHFGDPWGAPKDGKVVWYWSLREYLNNTIIENRARTGEIYQPWWSNKPIKRMVFTKRPATVGDWKRDVVGK
jgi:hypothetical protein